MVFKGRFFSSKKSDPSSPDGSSNSPRSLGSNSPIRSDKKKAKSASTSKDNSPITPSSISTFATFKDKKKDDKGKESPSPSPNSTRNPERTREPEVRPTSVSVSPIVASSLGLNKIKTRSGPLPQESFFGYASRDKGNSLGASNLSKNVVGVGDGTSSSFLRKKDEKKSLMGSAENVDNGSNVDSMSSGSGRSRDQSPHVPGPSRLQNGESSSEAGRFSSSWGYSGGLRSSDACTPELKTSLECDNPKESESPRFQALLRVTSAPRKRFPADIKSFSHELNSKGVRPFPFWKPRGLNNLEEVLTMIRAKFDKAKEDVDNDLRVFAADLVGVLEKNAETHPDWQETIEDLLVLARRCAMTSPGEFWLQCEGIVQELDDRRQELPMGTLKQLHTRMLFILTRCTRLLQFHKESGFAEDEPLFQLRQSLQPVEKRRDGKMSGPLRFPKLPPSKKSYSQEQHSSEWKRDQAVQPGKLQTSEAETAKKLDSPGSRNRMASWRKFPTPAAKSPKGASPIKEENIDSGIEASKLLNDERGPSDLDLATVKHPDLPSARDSHAHSSVPSKHHRKLSWGYWGDQPSVSDESSIICRICEEEVPTLHVEDHSRICAIADRCDKKGLSVSERLIRIADTLENLMESFAHKDTLHAVGSPDGAKVSNCSVTEESELLSPKLSDWSCRGSEDMLDCLPEVDNPVFMDELKGLPSMSCKTRFGPKSDQGMTTSSAGSMTPRSPLLTPKTSPIDLLLAGKGCLSEHDDLPQMNELADISRCVANTPTDDDRSLSYLLSCLDDLKVVTERRKFDALTVETFGTRIEKLIREQYLQLCELVDDDKVDLTSTVIDEDAPLEDDVVRSLRTSPVHSKDRTSIDDFEIIKPISRGAFGRVFLAKKRTTGDLFAIKAGELTGVDWREETHVGTIVLAAPGKAKTREAHALDLGDLNEDLGPKFFGLDLTQVIFNNLNERPANDIFTEVIQEEIAISAPGNFYM
ncbi:putative serine/threonine protein kinase ireh1 [Datura stramonium]|uniref:non-specific serine/threonine protein kinase n=1 Tax=Datura stramonium TaxID=4076 RepID=A0ABS8RK76_DATST|nr:putative serine/threonine protein kinase ireh1 [Datura stramonium]